LFDLGALMYRTKPKFKDVMRILLNRWATDRTLSQGLAMTSTP
jgi:hypothetical protein